MKCWWIAVAIAIGCGSSKEAAPSAGSAARVAVDDPIGFCVRARGVVMRRRKCFPEDTSLKMLLAELAKLEGDAPTEPGPRRKHAARCAKTLDGLMRTEQPQACPLDATDEERAELAAFLAAGTGEQPVAPPTPDAGAPVDEPPTADAALSPPAP